MDRPLKAYEDVEFLKCDECRPVRLQLELLKPEVLMQEHLIRSTLVLFGSARTLSPEDALAQLNAAEQKLAAAPSDDSLRLAVAQARERKALSHYYGVARELARLVSGSSQGAGGCDFVVMTGGGGGIMEAGNRGAADVEAKSIGLNISLPFEQHPNEFITEDLSFCFHYFSIRKMHFLLRARALCAFPGGFGTLDELFETLTLIQTHKIPRIPVLLFGREFWEDLINWDALVRRQLISPEDLDIFQFVETAEEGWEHIRAFCGDPEGVL
ncbi:MAG: LOG family protein [Lentisphaerae bacterium]|jgi:uncharacterized protein (TIGR00730 family)|nr:LOG family protein [Lentisphaerota bacterium]MBT4820609.1 LOG family protein [Lentisphaerota bacterium]MBT5605381.1 LOG family protein [Lentisphaerota bacterium]MBT7060386.1 LOG family protein [Lentisphaerota bacterium]MBT7844760.1 LOG family protein [Lentisphaerota bacterium]